MPPWDTKGNPGTSPNDDFLGTTDNQPLAIRTNGKERMRFGSDTADPPGEVTIPGSVRVGAGGWGRIKTRHVDGKHFQNDDDDGLFLNRSTRQPVLVGHTDAPADMLVSGSLGIGILNPLNTLHAMRPQHLNAIFDTTTEHLTAVVGTEGSGLRFSDSNFFFIGSQPYADRNDFTGGNVHLAIFSNGNVGIGTTDPQANLEVAGDIKANDVFLNSDARLKTDVTRIAGALRRLQKMRGVTFAWGDGPDESSGSPAMASGAGVIAQEVEGAFPELVDSRGEGGYKGVNYGGLVGVLVEASKELKEENDALKRRIEALERAMAGG